MWSVVAPSKAGNLAVLVVDLEAVDIRRRCPLALVGQALALLPDLVVMAVVSEVALVAGEDSVVVEEDSVVTGLALVVVVWDTKVAAAGLVAPLPMHPLVLVVDEAAGASLAEAAGLIVVALAATVSP